MASAPWPRDQATQASRSRITCSSGTLAITSAIIGKVKAWTYVGLVALFATASGLAYGAWVDGASVWLVGLCLVVLVGLLALGLYQVNKRNLQKAVAPQAAIPEER